MAYFFRIILLYFFVTVTANAGFQSIPSTDEWLFAGFRAGSAQATCDLFRASNYPFVTWQFTLNSYGQCYAPQVGAAGTPTKVTSVCPDDNPPYVLNSLNSTCQRTVVFPSCAQQNSDFQAAGGRLAATPVSGFSACNLDCIATYGAYIDPSSASGFSSHLISIGSACSDFSGKKTDIPVADLPPPPPSAPPPSAPPPSAPPPSAPPPSAPPPSAPPPTGGSGVDSAAIIAALNAASIKTFCFENPKAAACVIALDKAASAACSAPFQCSGDVINCAQLKDSYDYHCGLISQQNAQLDIGRRMIDGTDTSVRNPADPSNRQVVDLPSALDSSSPISAACPRDVIVAVAGNDFVLPLSSYCDMLTIIGNVFFALSLLTAARIIGSA